MKTNIYYLCREDKVPFYVGKANNLKIRENQHKLKLGKNIILETIDEIPTNEWKFWEKHYISLFKSWGFILVNKNEGGGGELYRSEETKQKLRKPNPKAGRRGPLNQEIKNKISKSKTGKHHTEETKLKISNSNKGKLVSQETLDKKRKAMVGKKFTEETKLKMSMSSKGKTKSLLHKEKIKIHLDNIKDKIIKAKSKPVLQYDLEGNFIKEWNSMTEVSNTLKEIKTSGISRCICGNQNYYKGFIWKIKII